MLKRTTALIDGRTFRIIHPSTSSSSLSHEPRKNPPESSQRKNYTHFLALPAHNNPLFRIHPSLFYPYLTT